VLAAVWHVVATSASRPSSTECTRAAGASIRMRTRPSTTPPAASAATRARPACPVGAFPCPRGARWRASPRARPTAVAVTEGHWRLLGRYLEHHLLEGTPLRSLQFLAASLTPADAPARPRHGRPHRPRQDRPRPGADRRRHGPAAGGEASRHHHRSGLRHACRSTTGSSWASSTCPATRPSCATCSLARRASTSACSSSPPTRRDAADARARRHPRTARRPRGVAVALTKADLVDDDWLELARDDVRTARWAGRRSPTRPSSPYPPARAGVSTS
jgi:hypothetical protein